jgi:beta-galactosidase GanA
MHTMPIRLKHLAATVLLCAAGHAAAQAASVPTLRQQGTATQLIVDGKPFLVLGGELHNSSASQLDYLNRLWPRLKAAGLNTVIAPVEWDQVEPSPGRYDFTVLDGMVRQARANGMKIVLLWFGAWKNSMSTYVPDYVKLDSQRFARARTRAGEAQEILTPFDPDTLAADSAALSAMLRHLAATDRDHTVVMLQIENEIGMLPEVRDYGPQAEQAWRGQVPAQLIAYLQAHAPLLQPNVRRLWEEKGAKTAGTWSEVFGDSIEAQEVFQAWGYAAFAEQLASAAKAAYPIPSYVNVALNRPGRKPGEYPSAGPLPHLFDIWKAGAPTLDLIGMDIYFNSFMEWARKFKRPDNPLFVPEANRTGRNDSGANAFWAIGELDAIGYSPFGIEDIAEPSRDTLPGAYAVLRQLAPLILEAQGKGKMRGFKAPASYDGVIERKPQEAVLGRYLLNVSFANQWSPTEDAEIDKRGGLVIQLGEDEFLVAGRGIIVTFRAAAGNGDQVGFLKLTEGGFENGVWKEGRWLNGDESHQGRHVRLEGDGFSIQRVKLYRYR